MITYEIHCIVKCVDVIITILEIAHFYTCFVAKIVAIFRAFMIWNHVFEFLIVLTVVHVDEFTNVLQRSWLTRNMWSEDVEFAIDILTKLDLSVSRWLHHPACGLTSDDLTIHITTRSISRRLIIQLCLWELYILFAIDDLMWKIPRMSFSENYVFCLWIY